MQRLTLVVLFILFVSPCAAHPDDVSRANDDNRLAFPGHDTHILVTSVATESATAVLELAVPAKSVGAPPHRHAKEDEFFYVLEGEVTFFNADGTHTLQAGDMITLPRGNLHGFYNTSAAPARLLLVVSPGQFASFFDAVVMTLREQGDTANVGAVIAEKAAKFDVTIDMQAMPEAAKKLLKRP